MVPMVYSGDREKLIHEKNLKSNSRIKLCLMVLVLGKFFKVQLTKGVRVPYIQYYCLEFVTKGRHCLGRKNFHSFSYP